MGIKYVQKKNNLCFFSSGDVETAVKFAAQLIDLGADTSLRSRWTNMNALHYAAYFDVPELIRVILKTSKPKGKCWWMPVTNGCSIMASVSMWRRLSPNALCFTSQVVKNFFTVFSQKAWSKGKKTSVFWAFLSLQIPQCSEDLLWNLVVCFIILLSCLGSQE